MTTTPAPSASENRIIWGQVCSVCHRGALVCHVCYPEFLRSLESAARPTPGTSDTDTPRKPAKWCFCAELSWRRWNPASGMCETCKHPYDSRERAGKGEAAASQRMDEIQEKVARVFCPDCTPAHLCKRHYRETVPDLAPGDEAARTSTNGPQSRNVDPPVQVGLKGDEAAREAERMAEAMVVTDWHDPKYAYIKSHANDSEMVRFEVSGAGRSGQLERTDALLKLILTRSLLAFASRFPRPADSREHVRLSPELRSAVLEAQHKESKEEAKRLRAQLDTERADRANFWTMIEEREKLLREMEWEGEGDTCPFCRMRGSHAPGCRLAAVLGKGEGNAK